MNINGFETPAGYVEAQHLPANPLQPPPKSLVDRLPRIFGRGAINEKLPAAITVHPCVINGRRTLVYEKGLSRKDPAALAGLKRFAQENGFGLKEDQRTARKKINFDRRKARTIPTLMLVSGIFLLNNASYAAGSSKFRDWLLGEEAQAMTSTTEIVLDATSRHCMSCHQYNITVKSPGAPMEFQGHQSKNHPVGMNYGDHAADEPRGYIAVAALNRAIRLVDGNVACITCHKLKEALATPPPGFIKVGLSGDDTDPHCTSTRELTVGPRATDLCLSCHIK